MAIYNAKIGEMTRDNLFTSTYVKQIVVSGTPDDVIRNSDIPRVRDFFSKVL